MSEATTYDFAGTKFAVLVNMSAESPSRALTGISKAINAVVTSANHGLADGDVVKIANVLGMTQVNGKTAVIEVLSANTFALLGVDSRNYGTYTSGGIFDVGEWSDWCQVTNYNRQGGTAAERDTTTNCTVGAKTFKLGLSDPGTSQIDYFFAPLTDSIQQQIALLDASKAQTGLRIELPESGGTMVQLGTVQQTSEQASVDNDWTASLTLRNSGPRYDFAA